ncbi:hypothetical protein [Desulfolutivibrio sp.]|uniref:hypothetical protein n=1 Tax=Desulfolutivibrio sp. TaxID=2773296 RepID=UPI002F961D9F
MRGLAVRLLLAAFLLMPSGAYAVAGKIDTSSFTAYYAAQSKTLHAHLGKVVDAYADFSRRGAVGPMKDVLAARGTLVACWELFLNAGDMVYLYNRLDPSCEKSVKDVGSLMRTGLSVVSGKIEKELQWLDVTVKNLNGQPVAAEIAAAATDFRETAAALRRFSVDFAKPVTPAGTSAAKPGGSSGAGRPGDLSGASGPRAPSSPSVPAVNMGGKAP